MAGEGQGEWGHRAAGSWGGRRRVRQGVWDRGRGLCGCGKRWRSNERGAARDRRVGGRLDGGGQERHSLRAVAAPLEAAGTNETNVSCRKRNGEQHLLKQRCCVSIPQQVTSTRSGGPPQSFRQEGRAGGEGVPERGRTAAADTGAGGVAEVAKRPSIVEGVVPDTGKRPLPDKCQVNAGAVGRRQHVGARVGGQVGGQGAYLEAGSPVPACSTASHQPARLRSPLGTCRAGEARKGSTQPRRKGEVHRGRPRGRVTSSIESYQCIKRCD